MISTYRIGRILSHLCLWTILIVISVGCRVNFNFTGGNVDTSLETLNVEIFTNEAQIVVPYLAQETTQQIQDRFLNQSRLTLTTGGADVKLSGSVARYTIAPVAISGNERAARNRLTIGLRVKFDNNVNPDESWEQSFSAFVDFDADEDLSSVERDLIDEALDQLTQDIFSKSIGKW